MGLPSPTSTVARAVREGFWSAVRLLPEPLPAWGSPAPAPGYGVSVASAEADAKQTSCSSSLPSKSVLEELGARPGIRSPP